MNVKHHAAVILGTSFALLLSGCQTPAPPAPPAPERIYIEMPVQVAVEVIDTRMPLTIATIQRLSRSHENIAEDIQRFQLHLFGRVILEREYTIPNDSRDPDGRVRFENVHVREVITINDQTEGQALRAEMANGELLLSVSFDDGDDVLIFSSRADDPDGFFTLQYDVGGAFPLTGDERGLIEFGGNQYRLRYTGDRAPYLLIRLTQSDVDRMRSRTLGGRRVQ